MPEIWRFYAAFLIRLSRAVQTSAARLENGIRAHTENPTHLAKPMEADACVQIPSALCYIQLKTMSLSEMKRQEAQSRMNTIRKARRGSKTAAKLQHRASLVGDGSKWRITNLNQVARAIAKWT